MKRVAALACFSVCSWLASPAAAEVSVSYQATSRAWADTTSAAPIGGNRGTTLGEQRRMAWKHAIDLWEARLDGEVPITLDVTFDALGCGNGATILGQATNLIWYSGISGHGADPTRLYPSALANQLEGKDLAPDRSDIKVTLNQSVDAECKKNLAGFYYGFDGKSGDQIDFVHVVLHELAHGLGIDSALDPSTGALAAEGAMGIDAYSAHLRDLARDELWADMSNADRKTSMQNVRGVVWDGARAAGRVSEELAHGEPELAFEPRVPAFSGFIADSNAGALPFNGPITGEVVAVRGCNSPASPTPGKILLFPLRCGMDLNELIDVAAATQAAGALLTGLGLSDLPPLPVDGLLERPPAKLPMFVLSQRDANAIVSVLGQGPLRARMTVNERRETGADEKHRPFVFITRPNAPGSSIAHLEPLIRPDQLMEPVTGVLPAHDLALTVAMLADMGWSAHCGDGTVADGELCDDGPKNSDHTPDSCRSDCTKPRCGDGVRDTGEDCDDGALNRDDVANACRTDCHAARCGDAVIDRGEQCDDGARNSDSQANACRNNCMPARCGDAVLDAHEACDDGAKNSDTRANACRKDCGSARCGDGVKDDAEACDEGAQNSDTRADACRKDCSAAHCGDGVQDADEECDDGPKNSDSRADACRNDCTRARCGDGVKDSDEPCDGTSDCSEQCRPLQKPPGEHGNDLSASAGAGALQSPAADSGGCGCRIAHAPTGSRSAWPGALSLLTATAALRRTRRRARGSRNKQHRSF